MRTINSWFWAVEETANLSALVVPGCYPISGTLFSDANGLTDGTVNGTGSNLGGSFAVLVDDSGKVVASTPIAANGTYTFNNIETGNYSVQINTTAPTVGSPAPSVQLPTGFTSSGENIGSGAGSDGTPNGILPVALAFAPVTSANLGATPKDTDGDGVPDSVDLDDDNDGILDTVEGVCTNSTLSSLNTPNYPLTTQLQNTSLPLVGLASGGVMSFNATLSGTGTWGNGVQIRNDFPGVNDYIYLQPTNVASGAGAATYEINFAYPLTNVVFTAGGLNNNDQHIITAFNGVTPITIDPSNFSGFSPALPAQWTVSGNTVSNATSAGGTDVTTNLFTTTIPGPVTRIVIVSSKSSSTNTGTVTTSLQGFQFCPNLDFDNDGIPNSEDLDSDNDGCSDANEYYNSATADGGSGQYGPGPDPVATGLDGKVTAASYVGTYLLDSTVATACGKPVPNPDVNQTWVNVPVTGDVSTNDEVPVGSTYGNPPANPSNPGTAVPTINSDGTYTFTSPVPGVFTFKVPVTYPNGDIDSVDLVITVLSDNIDIAKPVANVDLATTPLNTPVSLNTLGNDVATNPSNPLVPSSVTVTDAPSNGTTSVDTVTGNITYTPNPGFSGKDTLTYTVTDANGNTVTAQQIITILPAGAPNTTTATDDYKSGPYNTPVSGNAISNDQDAEGDVQAIVPQVTTIAGKGTLTLNSDGTYTFVPVSGFSGPVEFPYSIYDNDANPDSATATIHILIAPPAPVPNPDVNQTWVNVPVTGDVSTNDEVPVGSTYGNPPANPSNPGTAVPTINSDGTYTFTSPVPGVFTFKVPVTYPNGDIDSVDLVITVLSDNIDIAKPVANVDLATTPLNTPVSLNTLGNDVATNPSNPLVPSSVTVTDAPSNGTTSVDTVTGNITYTPNPGFSGKDTLTYTVTDANGNTVTAQQIITILPAGAPNTTTATDDYKSGPYNTPVSGNAISNDQDAEGDVQAIVPQVTTIAGKGTLTLNSDGTYTFVPVSGFSGPVEFPYSIYDNDANPDSATATIHILIAPPAPAPTPDVNQTWVNVPVTGDVSTNDEVPTGSTYGNPPANPSNPGTAVPTINSDGTYTFTSPVPGVFTFKVPVTYPNGDIDSVDLVITVLDDADPNVKPVANVDLATTPLNTPVSLNTLGNDVATNPSNPLVPSSVTVTDAPSNGTTSVDTVTGNITYTPNPGFSGKDTLTYTVTDANGNTVTAQQIITILPAGAPNTTTATDDYKSGPYNTPVSGNAISNDQDAEGDVQAIVPQVTTIAGKGTLTLNSDGTYTFVPVSGFSGPVEFPYSIYDNDANPDSATATIHILIAPPVPAPTPDVNQTWVNVPVTGDVSINDEVPAGSTYGNPPANPSNPGTAVPTINSDGTYTFTSPVPGVFTFKVPVTYPNGDIDSVDLVITVLDDADPNVKPVANVDLATTPLNTPVSLNTLGNDVATNPSNPLVPSSVTVTDAPSNGTTSVDTVTGNITYTPNPGFSGKDTLTYTVTDANGNTVTAQQIITILPAGAPNTTTATDDYKSGPYNTPVSGNAISNDQDAEGDVQAIVPQVTTIAGKGTLTLNSDGTYTFVPVSGFSGPVEFPYSIYDNDANPDSATATIHILIAPPAPAPTPDVNQTWVNVPVTGDVSTNDEVPAGSTYGNPPANPSNPGTAVPTINSDGTYTFTSPVPGVFTFKVPVTYPNGDIDSVDLVITVLDDADPNVKPVANVDLATTPLNTPVSLNTLGNDVATNPSNPLVPSSVTVTDAPSNGTTSVDTLTGNITYTPNPGFSGKDTLTYTVTDANGNTVTAQQIITILPAGAPNTTTATDDYKSGPYNTPVSGNAISNDQDAEGDVQAIVPQVTTIAGKGTLTLNSDGTYTFVPVSGFSGPVEFPYSIYDNDANPDSATATIHILIAPPAPAPTPDVNQTWVNVPVTGDVSTNDEVPTGSTYGNPPANPSNPGTAVPTINSDGTYTFTSPVPGVFTFKVPVTYPNGDIDSVDLVITVLDDADPNVKPVANVDLATTPLNTPVSLNTLGNDVATNPSNPLVPSSVTVTDAPSNGTTSVDTVTGNITYTPNPGFSGKDTLTYTVTDANGNTVTAQQIITILPAGAPNTTTATDDYKSGPYNTPVSGNAISNDQDAEGDVQAIVPQVTTIAGKGTLTLNSDGTYTFVPVSGFSGPVEFPYSIYDNDANPDSATATIHILIAPPAPAPTPDVNQTWVNVPVTGDVSTNDEVPAGSTYGNPPANPSNPGTAVPTINSDGTYTFTSPVPGVFTFKVPVTYPNGDIDSVDLVITVLDDADPNVKPVANVDLATTPLNTPVSLNTLGNDVATNPSNPLVPSSVTVTDAPSNGTTSVDTLTGNITYTPNPGFSGKDTLTYTVTDANGNTVTAQQIITILPAGAPNTTTATDDYKSGPYNTPVSGNAISNDQDAEGDVQAIVPQVTTIAGKGTLTLNSDGTYTFVPVSGFSGPVEFPYSIYDNDANPDSATATIHILIAPPAPAPNPDVNVTWAQVPVTGDVSTNDVVPAGSTYGNPPANPANPDSSLPTLNSDGTYTFTSPIPGVFTFKVPVVYPNGNIDSVDLVITVLDSASNTNPPAANTDIASTPINIPVTLVTLSNDYTTNTGTGVGLNPALVTVIENPSNGTTIVDPVTGDITYFPNAGFVGKDTLKYSVTDSLGNIVEAYQIITIIDTAIAPNSTAASDDYTAVTTTAPVFGNALGNDTDPEGDSQTVTPFTSTIPGKGTLVLAADGSFTFTPVAGFVGPVAFPYTATDVRGATADATIYVLVDATSAPLSIFDLTLIGKVGNGANYLSADVNTAAEIAAYKLYRKSKESNVFEHIATVNGGNDFEYSDYSVNSAFNAYYIEAIGINNVIVRSNTVNLSTVLLDQVVISPNPASSNVAIRFNAAVEGVAKVSITDMTGKVVMIVNASLDLGFNAVSVDVNSLPAGNYTIQLSRPDQEVSSFRFQKN